MAECVEIVRPLRRYGEPVSYELYSESGERLMYLCHEHAAWWRRALGGLVRPVSEGG